ncbi:MAG: hypothetical protein HYU57_08455 [Micavibrio aeruginosavorus]|nr:hypothetical protein [Micavibrio aeruginosavorus]
MGRLLFAVLAIFLLFPQAAQAREIKELKVFKDRVGHQLVLERESEVGLLERGIERIQFRNDSGRIVAYTPVRVTAIPFCPAQEACWVFVWKTVYPLPAIFKFNPDPQTWTAHPDPPFKYARGGLASRGLITFEGFEEKLNPLFGVFGLALLVLHRALYFALCIFLTGVMFLQIAKYHDMSDIHRTWVRRIISAVMTMMHLPLPVEPYVMTAILLLALAYAGIDFMGVPLAVSLLVIMVTLFTCATFFGKARRKKAGAENRKKG